ncbi:MAG: signal recognition particle receptor subunit alpha, partial [Chthoniobacterales bacterium]
MFSRLSDKLQDVFKDLRGHGRISEENVNEALREVRMALLEADVHFKVAKDFVARVKEKSLGQEVLRSVTPGQQIVKIFHDELTALLGSDAAPLELGPQARILVVGLNGAGKTTTCAKLALYLKKMGRTPVLIACDLQRPAAIEQLATLAAQIGVPMYRPAAGEKNVLRVVKDGMAWAKQQSCNVEVYDTSGRQDLDDDLIDELRQVKDLVQPNESLLVCDAATGQQAVGVAEKFHGAVGVTGLILT